MNVRDLIYIKALAKFRHFGHAAQACHVSQPALSTQVKKLEDELGIVLFERDNRSVRVTDAGRDIVALAEDALAVIENIKSAAETARDPLSGHLRIGSIPTIAPYVLPEFVAHARGAMPDLKLQFREDITERLNEALLSGDIDAAVLATAPEDPKLDVIELYDEPFWVIFPQHHKLQDVRLIRTQDLPVDELLLLAEGHCFRDQAMDVCRLDSANENYAVRATSLETLINMVAARQGVTLVPAMALNPRWTGMADVQAEKLNDKSAYRRIYLTYRKTFPRKALLDKVADIFCADLPSSVRVIKR
ncbi:LysR substrate-binding domain-containing protein [Robiginitomaculum antarcticum]|uniref:LysR substrate-binding domain-containing protein n=1 Tax=Robiginitomaculum antarcticum TaxID=437507 RepID=UPI000368435C|nr:LysR substrate-binding domain-containing protein [Robiginitomaculum antarcticum]